MWTPIIRAFQIFLTNLVALSEPIYFHFQAFGQFAAQITQNWSPTDSAVSSNSDFPYILLET